MFFYVWMAFLMHIKKIISLWNYLLNFAPLIIIVSKLTVFAMALEDFESKLNFLCIKCKTNAPLYFKMHRFCTALVLYQNLSGLPQIDKVRQNLVDFTYYMFTFPFLLLLSNGSEQRLKNKCIISFSSVQNNCTRKEW